MLSSFNNTRLLLDVEGGLTVADLDKLSSADRPWRLILKPWREHRSLDANAYCWVLLHKLAEYTGDPVESIYRRAIREIGGVSQTVCVLESAVQALVSAWEGNGLGWQSVVFPSKIDGCKNVTLYAGSSTFDTSQMTRLIDYIAQDCAAVGISTKTPEQVDKMLSLWREADDKKHNQHRA